MRNEEDVKLTAMIAYGNDGTCSCASNTCSKIKHMCGSKENGCLAQIIRKHLSCPTEILSSGDNLDTMLYVLYILSATVEEYKCVGISACNDCAWIDHTTHLCRRINIRCDYKSLYTLRANTIS